MNLKIQSKQNQSLEIISQSLNKTKLSDVIKIKVKDKFYLSDWFFIATASSKQQAQSSARKLKKKLSQYKISCQIEGLNSDSWVLIYTPNCLIHIFVNQYRDHYNLEGLWNF